MSMRNSTTCVNVEKITAEVETVPTATISNSAVVDNITLPVATKDEYDRMIQYCKTGNLTALKALFDSYDCRSILNMKNEFYRSLLFYATDRGFDTIVHVLLRKGADINIQDGDGNTALMCACIYGDETIVQILLDSGADVKIQNKYGDTALMYACREEHTYIGERLVGHGADTNMKNLSGYTAFDLITDEDIKQYLLEEVVDHNSSYILK